MAPRFTYIDAQGDTRLKAWALPVVVAAITLPIVASFLVLNGAVGLAVTALVAVTVVVIAARTRPFRAMEVAAPAGKGRRVLVLAPVELEAPTAERVAKLAADAEDVRILVPVRSARLDRWLSAEDRARDEAERRLARSAGALTAAGLPVSGSVGDSDPIQAVEDELRSFAASEVVVVTDADAEKSVERLRNRLALPLTRVPA
jgi:hypothetical protein